MTYEIVRFYQDDRPAKVLKSGVTRDEAQAHCNDPTTHDEGWFDGYRREGGGE